VEAVELLPRDDKNVISEATIQIINDLLKKYEKEFLRFTTLYESEMDRTKQLAIGSYQQRDCQKREQELEGKVRMIEQLIGQKQNTIELL
jgi:hypothetical protein